MDDKKEKKTFSRRKFISRTATVAAGISIVPRHVLGGVGYTAPSDALNIAGIGVGGMGAANLGNITGQNIVALADVDWKYAAGTFNRYPKAKKYKDYRKMFDDMSKDIDAVVIATPDHTHAITAADSMKLGKHVYLQKPLTHSIYESRYLTQLAKETGVATQMGNQGHSGEGTRLFAEWIQNGEIGDPIEAHSWTNRPIWPQGLERPKEQPPIPATLDWDLFIGPANYRPYHPSYTPWNWRAWWDFGTGALGDMGCHLIDPVYFALNLGQPIAFEGSSSQVNTESAPIAEKVTYYFPERKKLKNIKMPELKFTWYDGGLLPERPEGMIPGKIMGDDGGGAMVVGTKGTIICSTYGRDPYIVGRENDPPKVKKTIPRVSTSHEMDWVRACKEPKGSRTEASSNFMYSGPFNEVVVMGDLAVRLQDLKKKLEWDAEKMEITNINDNEEIRVVTSDKFTVVEGDPKFDTQYATINAKQASQEYIKHNYREGWKLS
ncbi:Gfo/Idh/MocA family protein [Zunongwangia profunda]|uniref:Gfo/Idh/MocA family protein n=1 Tax=Zunongwangia profunda TaxID=398743 RepID=UPI002356B571|nr:Gfo/Idh/MocA family oxidoreductase [Zunongwangia profunda]|tara:strand:+ start:4866 stop:6341 length:1476 start_codon:yes stop_codon:yes gene_type:complete